MLLSRHIKKQKAIPPAPLDRAHPLQAVPLRAESVEERVSDRGELHLHGIIPPTGLFERTMARIAKAEKTIQIVLDEKGAFFWKQIDGERNLFAIRKALQQEYQLTPAESKEATILFVKMLMRRNLIRLQVHPKKQGNQKP